MLNGKGTNSVLLSLEDYKGKNALVYLSNAVELKTDFNSIQGRSLTKGHRIPLSVQTYCDLCAKIPTSTIFFCYYCHNLFPKQSVS